MKRFGLLLSGMMLVSAAAFAQQKDMPSNSGAVLKFENTHHDFGKIKEDDGPVTYVFNFTNTGTKNLILTHVQPACGCTASKWTKDSVAPGKQGFVSATYDVNHRPGAFSKSITVYSNSNPSISLLTFSGEVIPHVKTVNDSFPYQMGNLRFEENNLNFDRLYNNQKDTMLYLNIYNEGTKPVTIKDVTSTTNYISGKGAPVTIEPKQRVKYPVHYNASANKDYGLEFDEIKLITNDDKIPEKKLSILAEIHQYIPKMSEEELKTAPKIFFPQVSHDFGTVKQGDIVNTEFEFTNKGKKDLVIYKVKTSCGCTVSEPEKSKIKAGQTSKIKVSFNSAGKNGKEDKHITVISNDPVHTEYDLTIHANVVLEDNTNIKKEGK